MNGLFDILFFAALAAFFAFRLYNTLGKKDFGDEDRVKEILRQAQEENDQKNNVVTLRPDEISEVKEYIPDDPALKGGLQKIQAKEPDFTMVYFLSGASRAFEMIIESYGKGDLEKLKSFVGKEVYTGFEKSVNQRQKEKKQLVTALETAPVLRAEEVRVEGANAEITVLFTTNEISVMKDEKGRIIEGDPSESHEVKDRWTFAKKLGGKDTMWKLVKTEAVE